MEEPLLVGALLEAVEAACSPLLAVGGLIKMYLPGDP